MGDISPQLLREGKHINYIYFFQCLRENSQILIQNCHMPSKLLYQSCRGTSRHLNYGKNSNGYRVTKFQKENTDRIWVCSKVDAFVERSHINAIIRWTPPVFWNVNFMKYCLINKILFRSHTNYVSNWKKSLQIVDFALYCMTNFFRSNVSLQIARKCLFR